MLMHRLLANPASLDSLSPEQERSLVLTLRSIAVAEHPTRPVLGSVGAPTAVPGEEDLLTIDEAAAMLRVSPRWLYRHAKALPFCRKLSRKVLRFSRSGIGRWLASRRT